MLKDRYDLDVTTSSTEARDAYIEGTDAILAATPEPELALERSIAADPDFALPWSALARQHQLMGRPKQAREAADKAVALAEYATEREQQHAKAYLLMVTGKGQDALALTHEHMQRWPRDAFLLAPSCGVFGLIGFSGRKGREPEQLELLAPLAKHYGDDWWFLSAHAFALLEMGQWTEARQLIERSLEQFPRNAHAAHIRAHALYEAGEDEESRNYLESWMPDYPSTGLMHCHLWWHTALMRLVAGDIDGMWDAFDNNCAPDKSTSPTINIMTDGAALLWRAELAGIERPTERWNALCEWFESTFPKPMVFVDAHGGLPYAATGNDEGLAQFQQLVQETADKGRLPAGDIGIPLSSAFGAFAKGQWSETISTLEPIMDDVVCIGGSRAQRDLVTNTLLAAYINDGRSDSAKALLDSVHDRQPSRPVAGL